MATKSPLVLHLVVHARPEAIFEEQPVEVSGLTLAALRVESDAPWPPLATDFESALEELGRIPQLFVEPDGSFVWVSSDGPQAGQVDGQLHDSAIGLHSVELKLSGSQPALLPILKTLGWPAQPMLFQLIRPGIYVAESELRRLLAALKMS